MRFEFYRNNYNQELERKNHLNSALSLPIGVSTLLGSILYFYISSTFNLEYNLIFWVFVLFLLLSILSLGYTIYRIVKSYYNFSFRLIPTDDEWENYHSELQDFHKNDELSNRKLKEAIIKELTKAQKINSNANDLKSYHLHKANGGVIITLIFIIITAIPFFLLFKNDSENNLKSKLTTIMCEENQRQEPEAPEGRMIKEGEKPTEIKADSNE